ncbi:ferritin-like domain-containing protein [Desulfotomaculum copahuensis]|uniref:Bacterioferritin n=1 Tax=Desulfotomaculum copahuensis TaxID=1838280 RepID=A0A1B7LEU4_9FIRM|nr:manganese catalase family protein [Desulfotomaculum copahuensis]OAT81756.1 bacterioferritin [Desulfotomaculum copahuensis]
MDTNLPAQECVTPALYKCAYPAPYPEVRVVAQNPYYAQLLLEDYAGTVSEFSAISQYLYHHFVLERHYKDAADLLSCISLVEMHHMELLAKTIIKLGADPRLRTVNNAHMDKYWNASFVFYGVSLCDRISSDIASEWAAIENYRKHQQLIDDPGIKQLLGRIILDELHHIDLFKQVMQKYCRSQLPRQAPVKV